MDYNNGEEQTRIKCTKKHKNRARTMMGSHTQALRTYSQSKDLTWSRTNNLIQ